MDDETETVGRRAAGPWSAATADQLHGDVDAEIRTMEVRAIDPGSAARMAGGLYGAMGVIGGGFMALFTLASATQEPAALFGLAFCIAAPFFYGFMGALIGLVAALVYNVVAASLGGLRVTVA